MLVLYRERLLDMRTPLVNELRWQLHDLWPDWEIPAKALTQPGWQLKVARCLARAKQPIQGQIARDIAVLSKPSRGALEHLSGERLRIL